MTMSRAGPDTEEFALDAVQPVADPPRFVIVPREPGPLQWLRDRQREGGDDDIDAAMDELFGDITNEQPGRFDIALLVIGAALIGWWVISGASGPGLVLGAISIVLGLALPARNALRAANRRWTRAQDRRRMRTGYPLDAGDQAIGALVGAYEGILKTVGRQDARFGDEALGAAHRALVAVASLLETRRPTAPAELDYVKQRATAVKRLGASLKAASSRREREELRSALNDREARERWSSAVAAARAQLEASTGLGSLAEIDALRERIDLETGRGRPD